MEKKLIVFDIDGTLYWKGKVSQKTIDTIHQVKALGHVVTIATGRNSDGVYSIAEKLGMNDGKTPIIGLNGSEVFYLNENHEVKYSWEKIFPDELAKKVMEEAWKNNLDLFAYTTNPKLNYVKKRFSFFNLIMKLRRKTKNERLKKDLSNAKLGIKKFVLFGSNKKMKKFLENLKEYNFSIFAWSHITDAKANIELNLPNTDKVNGVKEAAKELNIAKENVIYFGDGSNDVESLKWAGIGVAMGNAKPQIVAHANIQTKHVKEDGVAFWLEENILKKKV